MKRVWGLLLLFCLLCLCLVSCGKPDETVVYDEKDILTQSEEEEIRQTAEGYRDVLGGASIVVICPSDFSSTAKDELAKLGYRSSFDDVMGLVIWESNAYYEYEIYPYGDMSRYISDADFYSIDRAIEADIKAGNPVSGAETFIRMTAAAYAAGAPSTGGKVLTVVLFAVIAGLIGGGVAVIIVVTSYRKKNRSASYPLSEYTRMYLTMERDIFLHHTVTKTRIAQSSGGSGGSRGGGSHGGGGGRSGGRH